MRIVRRSIALAAVGAAFIVACSSSGTDVSPGGGGTPDGGAPDGAPSGPDGSTDAPSYVPSAAMRALLGELQKLKAGQPADLDGDGTPDATQTNDPDGSSTYQDDQDGDGTPEFVMTDDGKGNVTITVDANGDGQPEQQIEYTVTTTTHKEVLTVDQDLDGTMDHRETWITQASSIASQAYTAEVAAPPDGAFTTVTTSTLSTSKNGGGDCEGNDNFPSGGTDYRPLGPGAGPVIKTGNDAGDCNLGDVTKIANAVDCAFSKGVKCLATTNSKEFNSLLTALAGRMTQLDIGCGNICTGVDASTRGFTPPFPDSKMNINTSEFDALDADGQCNMMLHELMHWAGDEGSADHNDPSGASNDSVYSCGRYCGGCSHALHGSTNNSSVDCAFCADTPDRKEKCGSKTALETGACQGLLTGICHAGLACIAADCDSCSSTITRACDGTGLNQQDACCATCPATCNASNDLPCTGAAPQSTDTCTDKTPPNCH